MQIPLSDILITLFEVHVLEAADQENTLALAQMHWLHYESLVVLLLIELLSEIVHFLRQNPGLREEIVLGREDFGHSHEISTQVVLASQLIHPWVMVDSLVRLELG